LVGHAHRHLRLSENDAGEQTEKPGEQHVFAPDNALCRPDSDLHAGILFDRSEMMPQR
jgi:hypothetical protein